MLHRGYVGDHTLTVQLAFARLRPMVTPFEPGPTAGVHVLVEYRDCMRSVLDDAAELERVLCRAATAMGAKVVTSAFHQFAPHGVTGFVLLEESHLSIHTWPERGYAAVDLFSCGVAEPGVAVDVLRAALGARRVCQLRVARGDLSAQPALRVVP